MKILVACEESGRVTAAFRAKGHEAFSCDILPTSGRHPEWHIQGDVLPLLREKWDMIIAFPPCTYLTNAGAVRMRVKGEIVPERYAKMQGGRSFFMAIYNADCPKIAIENPTPMKLANLPPCTQVIQPWEFGHPYSKRTCLWLKGLPPLWPTLIYGYHKPYVNGGCHTKDGKRRKCEGIAFSQRERSKTFPGIAAAMADQWG